MGRVCFNARMLFLHSLLETLYFPSLLALFLFNPFFPLFVSISCFFSLSVELTGTTVCLNWFPKLLRLNIIKSDQHRLEWCFYHVSIISYTLWTKMWKNNAIYTRAAYQCGLVFHQYSRTISIRGDHDGTFEDQIYAVQTDLMYFTQSAGGIFNFNIFKVSL